MKTNAVNPDGPMDRAQGPRYRCPPAGSLLWSRLAENDPQDVVVFDSRSGATHRVDAMALDVHELLVRCGQGLQCATITACLLHPGLSPFRALRRYLLGTPAGQRCEEWRSMSAWLGAWERSGLLSRVA